MISVIKNIYNTYKIPLLIAMYQFILFNILKIDSFFCDGDYSNVPVVVTSKILFLIFLLHVWCFVFYVYKKCKEGDKLFERGLKIFFIYFGILFILILAVWPGFWEDDPLCINIIEECSYKIVSWHHVVTSYFHLICLQWLPCPGGVIVIQNAIIAVIVSYIIVKLENVYNIFLQNKVLDILIKMLPFLMPPMVYYQFTGYRLGIYSYFELLFLCISLFAFKNKIKWTNAKLFYFSLLVALVSTWRSEAVIYMLLAGYLLYKIKNILTLKKSILCLISVFMFFILIFQQQSKNCGMTGYYLISIHKHVISLFKKYYESDYDAKILTSISSVLKIPILLRVPDDPNINILNIDNDIYEKSDSEKIIENYIKSYIYLVLKYPQTFLKERSLLYMNILIKVPNTCYQKYFFKPETNVYEDGQLSFFSLSCPFNWTLSENLREKVLDIFFFEYDNAFVRFLRSLIMTQVLPFIIFVSYLILCFYNKYIEFLPINIALTLKTLVIILTIPETNYMYNLYIILIGYTVLIYYILWLVTKRNRIDG